VTLEAWITLVVVGGTFVVMVRGAATPAVAILGAVVVLLGTGVLEAEQAFAGFANPAPITVAALYVLARAVESSGALTLVEQLALGDGQRGAAGGLRLLVPAAAASAFLNNTPIVAMLAPSVVRWSQRHGRPPSRLLMPLSFAVILGGVVTTIGTSTNLVVSGLLEGRGEAPLGLFEITPVGLPVAVLGLVVIALLAPRLVPDRKPPSSRLDADQRDFVVRMRVIPGGPLEGCTVEDAGLRHLEGVFLVEIERSDELIAPVAPGVALHGDDELIFVGRAREVVDLGRIAGLARAADAPARALTDPEHVFVEAVIGAVSPLVGRTPREIGFRSRYQAAVVGIHRAGQPVASKLGEVRLQLGDVLLLLADADFAARWTDRPDFLLVTRAGGTPQPVARKAVLAGAAVVAVVVVAGAGWAPILHASLLAALVLVAARVLSVEEARRSIDMDVILVIAASFALGAAIETSGLAAGIGHAIVGVAGDGADPRLALLAVVVATVILTEFISNNASAALMFPIATAAAVEIGADPRDFAIAVAVAASASFLTPIGYQTNTMVYGLGGYRFSDYWRLGAPLTAVVVATLVLLP